MIKTQLPLKNISSILVLMHKIKFQERLNVPHVMKLSFCNVWNAS